MISLANFIEQFNKCEDETIYTGIKNKHNTFEDTMYNYFIENNVIEWSKEEAKIYWTSFHPFEKIKNIDSVELHKNDNIPNRRDIFIKQPYSSQRKPDFLLLRRNNDTVNFIKLELKSSKCWTSIWNCSQPEPSLGWIYIHYNSKIKSIFSFFGSELITEEQYEKNVNIFKKFQIMLSTIKQDKNLFMA